MKELKELKERLSHVYQIIEVAGKKAKEKQKQMHNTKVR